MKNDFPYQNMKWADGFFQALELSSKAWIWEINTEGVYVFCSNNVERILGYPAREIIGKKPFDLMPDYEAKRVLKIYNNYAKKSLPFFGLENWNINAEGKNVCLSTEGIPIFNEVNAFCGYCGIDIDITPLKRRDDFLESKDQEIEYLTKKLEEMTCAWRILLNEREREINIVKDSIINNCKASILPNIEKLNQTQLTEKQKLYLDIIWNQIDKITSSFYKKVSIKYFNLTPTEIKIAGLVKDGKTTKEISLILNSSINAVKFHRYNIRKKMGIGNKKINLRSRLTSFT